MFTTNLFSLCQDVSALFGKSLMLFKSCRRIALNNPFKFIFFTKREEIYKSENKAKKSFQTDLIVAIKSIMLTELLINSQLSGHDTNLLREGLERVVVSCSIDCLNVSLLLLLIFTISYK